MTPGCAHRSANVSGTLARSLSTVAHAPQITARMIHRHERPRADCFIDPVALLTIAGPAS
jgi:hypothetical protein